VPLPLVPVLRYNGVTVAAGLASYSSSQMPAVQVVRDFLLEYIEVVLSAVVPREERVRSSPQFSLPRPSVAPSLRPSLWRVMSDMHSCLRSDPMAQMVALATKRASLPADEPSTSLADPYYARVVTAMLLDEVVADGVAHVARETAATHSMIHKRAKENLCGVVEAAAGRVRLTSSSASHAVTASLGALYRVDAHQRGRAASRDGKGAARV
jgi:hypothetical protein